MFAHPLSFSLYLGICLAVAYLGSNKKFGFTGNFFASVFLTPLVGFILLLAQSDK